MFKYRIELKPILLSGGIEKLDPDKRAFFSSMLTMLATMLNIGDEVESSVVQSDHSILVIAKKDVLTVLTNGIGKNAVITAIK